MQSPDSRPAGSSSRHAFASDNCAGICPEALAALWAANDGYAAGYGEDEWTRRACDLIRDWCGTDCEVFFVFTGTAANSLVVSTLCQSYHSVICHEAAHLETDECGAAEFFSNGSKVLLVGGDHGKLDIAALERTVRRRSDIHYPKPRAVSITQATELGTVYGVDELRAIGETAQGLGLRVHMDGARLMNAVASLGVSPADVTWKAGVDVLTLGGTKNGGMVSEAVVFFDRACAREFSYRCKQAGQLGSKMRFLAAPWVGMLQDGAWLEHARHANGCARRLEDQIRAIDGLRVMFPCQANAVFVDMPPRVAEQLADRGWHFYTFIGCGGARFMCSWRTQESDIAALVADLREAAGSRA